MFAKNPGKRAFRWPQGGSWLGVPLLFLGCGREPSGKLEVAESHQALTQRLDFALQWIDASGKQQQAIRALAERLQDQHRVMKTEKQALVDALKRQWLAEAVDSQALDIARKRGLAAAERFSQSLAEAFVELHDILNPAQRQKLRSKLEALREHRYRHHGHRRWCNR